MSQIEIYTKPGCGYCVSAKNLLKQRGIPFVEYNVFHDQMRFAELKTKTSNRTFPQIFIEGKSIGGFNELAKMKL